MGFPYYIIISVLCGLLFLDLWIIASLFFLVADTQLIKRLCPSVRPSILSLELFFFFFWQYLKNFKLNKELAKTVEEAEEMQIASKANILSEQKFKLSYPLFQHMMYKSCQSLLEIFKRKNELTNGQLKLLAANLQEKIISKVNVFFFFFFSR